MRAFSFPADIGNVLVGLSNQREDFVKKAVIENNTPDSF
jgi:hypothetical protein